MTKSIPLTKGKFALVDDGDYEWLMQRKWQYLKIGYAACSDWGHGNRKMIYMHRLINNTPDGKLTDHINLDKLDNRRKNLRLCSRSENGMNRTSSRVNSSGYKGVYFVRRVSLWVASIKVSGTQHHLGYFHSSEDAARAYDKAAKEYHGTFARCNFE